MSGTEGAAGGGGHSRAHARQPLRSARPVAALSVRPAGDRALLVECPDNTAALAVTRVARENWADELQDVVPGHRTVLLVWRLAAPDMGVVVSAKPVEPAGNVDSPAKPQRECTVTIDVTYDGADLGAVAEALGTSAQRVIELHSVREYRVAFLGFLPGFPYLIGGDPLLDVPRLATPRTAVPAGSIAIAAGYCGIYPRSAPGGWRLLGHTDAVLFDPERDSPALLEPGMRVRFNPVALRPRWGSPRKPGAGGTT